MQYTVRNIPKRVDQVLRQLARTQRKSLNQVAVEALAMAAGVTEQGVRHRDLGDLSGTWLEDPDFEKAIEDQEVIDEKLWK